MKPALQATGSSQPWACPRLPANLLCHLRACDVQRLIAKKISILACIYLFVHMQGKPLPRAMGLASLCLPGGKTNVTYSSHQLSHQVAVRCHRPEGVLPWPPGWGKHNHPLLLPSATRPKHHRCSQRRKPPLDK